MNEYTLKLKHDNGTCSIKVHALSISGAVEKVLNSEGCPESAILSIKCNEKAYYRS